MEKRSLKAKAIMAVASGLLAVGGVAAVGSAEAFAGTENCPRGSWCGWQHINYDGTRWSSAANTVNYVGDAANDQFSSVTANGGQCRYTAFYQHAYRGGSYFALNSKALVGTNYTRSNLVPYGWNDQISSVMFYGC